MKKFLTHLNEFFAKVEGVCVTLLLLSMILLAFLQVIMRNVFNQGIPWADSVVRLLVIWVAFLGAALATKLEQNLTIEVLTKYMPERGKHLSSAIVKIFAVIICLFIFKASLMFIEQERSTGALFIHLFPDWWKYLVIPVSFLLIPFHLSFSIAKDLRYFLKGKPA